MNFDNWVEHNRDKFGSEYEILFATRVLPLVVGLRCDAVAAQYLFIDSDGKNRYCDFTIIESQAVRVAIEIDGYDKRGTGTGMSYEDFLDWQRRQASLASQGWHVLRFANRDVREEPRRCAEHISRLLNRLRQAQTGHVEIVTIRSTPPEVIAVPDKVEDARPAKVFKRKNYKLLPLVAISGLVVLALWQKNIGNLADRAVPPTATAPSITSDSVPSRYVSADVSPAHAPLARASAPANGNLTTWPIRNEARVEDYSYGTLDCQSPLDWSVAKKHIGQVVTVIGPLLDSKSRPDLKGSPMWLDVGNTYPNQNRVTVVVWGKSWSKFNLRELDSEYWFETIFDEMGHASICITGKVVEYKGVPQIELKDPNQIRIAFHPNYR